LLHSGARYIFSDPAAAGECRSESLLLKKLAPHCIEETGGLFIAVAGDDERYISDFPTLCSGSGIPVSPLPLDEARLWEPALTDEIIAAYSVDDATIDPFKLSLDNIAHAQQLGCKLLRFHQVTGFRTRRSRITAVHLINPMTRREAVVEAEVVVNAAGAWAGKVAAMAGSEIPILFSKGTLLVSQDRFAKRVINRLRRHTDGDIIVPGGTVSILGTTSERVASPDEIYPEIHEVDHIINEAAAMMPSLADARYIRAYCGVRPLISSQRTGDDRNVSRGYELFDHAEGAEPIENFISITGGKLTTFRLMAEKAADLVCRRLGTCRPCRTHIDPLPDTVDARWTEPGLAPSTWFHRKDPGDSLLCECEMVPKSVVEAIVESLRKQSAAPSMKAIGLRSRVGKGPCQGTFCSQRVAAYLYDQNELKEAQGIGELRDFLRERWRGQHPLLWDASLAQGELLEAMHCGLFGLELEKEASSVLSPPIDRTTPKAG
jgi:glycerol-3-phosphate dehydrogenase